MTGLRLPSFNDFSPGIIGDIRRCLNLVKQHAPDFDRIVSEWDALYFGSADNKRARTNITATLSNIGLINRTPISLTDVGERVLAQPTSEDAAAALCRHIIEKMNGLKVVEAISNLRARDEKVTKDALGSELRALGIANLSTATTDHTTLRNWMVQAGILTGPEENYRVKDETLKAVIGASGAELDDIAGLTLPQRVFLQIARRKEETSGADPTPAKEIIDECLRDYRGLFDDDQFRQKVIGPLEKGGWIAAPKPVGGRGGKSGTIKGTRKLLDIPAKFFQSDFDDAVPPDLRKRLNTPRAQIYKLLESAQKHERGLGLELLALRMIMDLGLEPRGFRIRSKETSYAEVDLTAEGKNLLFSRWNFQCKNVTARVSLGDVAKEVGIAIYARAHVVAMVTTSDFSSDARDYAKEISLSTHLQFLFLTGKEITSYIDGGAPKLIELVLKNARRVMTEKRSQPIAPSSLISDKIDPS